jgi:hypothetical protein
MHISSKIVISLTLSTLSTLLHFTWAHISASCAIITTLCTYTEFNKCWFHLQSFTFRLSSCGASWLSSNPCWLHHWQSTTLLVLPVYFSQFYCFLLMNIKICLLLIKNNIGFNAAHVRSDFSSCMQRYTGNVSMYPWHVLWGNLSRFP